MSLCDPAANATTQAIYAYLQRAETEHFTLAGESSNMWATDAGGDPFATPEFQWIHNNLAGYPAVMSVVYNLESLNSVANHQYPSNFPTDIGGYHPEWLGQSNARAIAWHNSGGIVGVDWMMECPVLSKVTRAGNSVYGWNTTFRLNPTLDQTGGSDYADLVANIDHFADLMQQLADLDITVILRPFHECPGDWYWWNDSGPEYFKRLWRLAWDRCVNVKHLHNIIWAMNYNPVNQSDTGPSFASWYPGDDVVDLIGFDWYPDGPSEDNYSRTYSRDIRNAVNCMRSIAPSKPVNMPECQPVPDIGWDRSQGIDLCYFLAWEGKYLYCANPTTFLQSTYARGDVILRDELPSFTGPAPSTNTSVSFDAVEATNVVVVSSTEITCTAPTHADGTVPVTVTTPKGTSAEYDFTYEAGAVTTAPTAYMGIATSGIGWMDPVYYVTGSGVKTFDTSHEFDNASGAVFSLVSPPDVATIDSATGVVSIDTTNDLDWTTLTVRATNSYGHADTTIEVWVFTATSTITAGATALNTLSPSPGDIILVRAGTWNTTQYVYDWAGTVEAPIKLVAYPGETVQFEGSNIAGSSLAPVLNMGNCHDLEIRGVRFIDSRYIAHTVNWDAYCQFGFWTTADMWRIKVAQCEFAGFGQVAQGVSFDDGSSLHSWVYEYNNVHHCVMYNYPPSETPPGGPWGDGLRVGVCDGSLVRRNRVHENYGEGITFGANSIHYTDLQILENIVWDNWSENIYGSCWGSQIHRNIVWSSNEAFHRPGNPLRSIEIADEVGGLNASNNVVTNNWYLAGNNAPQYGAWSYPEGTGNVWTPNYTFPAVDSRWKTGGGPI